MIISATHILYPLFAMVLLVSFVVTLLWTLRNKAIRTRQVSIKYYRDYSGDEPNYNKVVSRHYSNLFEMPILFYVGVIVLYVTQHVTLWSVTLAWAYVVCRYVHTVVHLTGNNVILRFLAFLVSTLILLVMWVLLLIKLI